MNPALKTSSESPRMRVTAPSATVSSRPQVASHSGQVLKTVVAADEDMRHLRTLDPRTSEVPHAAARRPPVSQRPVGGVDERLAAVREAGPVTQPVHRVPEGQARPRVREAERATVAEVAERLLGQDHAVVLARWQVVVVHALHEPARPPRSCPRPTVLASRGWR